MKLEEERQALAAFVKRFDALGLGNSLPLPKTKLNPPLPSPGGAAALFAERQRSRLQASDSDLCSVKEAESPVRLPFNAEPSLFEEEWEAANDISFGAEKIPILGGAIVAKVGTMKVPQSPVRDVFGEKENIPA